MRAEAEWSCASCTFMNGAHAPICGVCSIARTGSTSVAAPRPATATATPNDVNVFNPIGVVELAALDAAHARDSDEPFVDAVYVVTTAREIPTTTAEGGVTGARSGAVNRWCFGIGAVAITVALVVIWITVEIVLVASIASSDIQSRTAWFAAGACYALALLLTVQVGLQRRVYVKTAARELFFVVFVR